ncbi:hypothetical protein MMPV_002151 [Pyropia vietnamensis]
MVRTPSSGYGPGGAYARRFGSGSPASARGTEGVTAGWTAETAAVSTPSAGGGGRRSIRRPAGTPAAVAAVAAAAAASAGTSTGAFGRGSATPTGNSGPPRKTGEGTPNGSGRRFSPGSFSPSSPAGVAAAAAAAASAARAARLATMASTAAGSPAAADQGVLSGRGPLFFASPSAGDITGGAGRSGGGGGSGGTRLSAGEGQALAKRRAAAAASARRAAREQAAATAAAAAAAAAASAVVASRVPPSPARRQVTLRARRPPPAAATTAGGEQVRAKTPTAVSGWVDPTVAAAEAPAPAAPAPAAAPVMAPSPVRLNTAAVAAAGTLRRSARLAPPPLRWATSPTSGGGGNGGGGGGCRASPCGAPHTTTSAVSAAGAVDNDDDDDGTGMDNIDWADASMDTSPLVAVAAPTVPATRSSARLAALATGGAKSHATKRIGMGSGLGGVGTPGGGSKNDDDYLWRSLKAMRVEGPASAGRGCDGSDSRTSRRVTTRGVDWRPTLGRAGENEVVCGRLRRREGLPAQGY